MSENSVAAGVRRIEAVTGKGVLEFANQQKDAIIAAAQALKLSNPAELASKCASVSAEMKALEKQVEVLNGQLAATRIDGLFKNAVDVGGVKFIYAKFDGISSDALRTMGDKIRDKEPSAVAVLAGVSENGASFVCACGKNAVEKGANAGKIVKEAAAVTGGKGGGRPDGAMAGIGDVSKIDEAFSKLSEIISSMLK